MTEVTQKPSNPRAPSVVGVHPDPAYFGFHWPEVEKLLAEHARLVEIYGNSHVAIDEKRHEKKLLEVEAPHKRAAAVRASKKDRTRQQLEKVQKDLEDLEAQREDIRRAAELVEQDLQRVLNEHRDEFMADIHAAREKAQGEAERLRAALAGPEWELDAYWRLERYLTQPKMQGQLRFMGTGPRPETPSDVKADV